MSKPYYGPLKNIDSQRYAIASNFVAGVGYGIQLVLWLSCTIYLWKTRRKGKNTVFLLCYIALLLVAQTVYCITQVRYLQVIYVENQRYPGGPWQYFLNTPNATSNVLAFILLCIIIAMCDLLVLWRCWVIWTALNHGLGYVVIALPALMFLASIVMGTFWIVKSVEPGNTLASPLPLQLGFAYFALSLGLNVVLTTLVVARLLAFRRANIAFLPPEHARQYLSITAVIVESAALYSVFAIMFLITYGLKLPVNLFLLECAQASQPIAVYLIIYRVAQRKAQSKDMLNEQTMSSANFCGGANARIHSATPRFINIEVEMESTVDTESGTLHNNR